MEFCDIVMYLIQVRKTNYSFQWLDSHLSRLDLKYDLIFLQLFFRKEEETEIGTFVSLFSFPSLNDQEVNFSIKAIANILCLYWLSPLQERSRFE